MKKLLMGNEAMAFGALRAGVGLVSGYPGTPSTEVLETAAKNANGVYVEWSVNEKAALEVASGASISGVRTLVTMKQVGLNVASDPIMSLAYIGVKGGMVVLVADDPGPISSQNEQDTRRFAAFSKLPVFDPSSPEEAYEMMEDAYALSEKYSTPVLFRPTTRICHACATIDLDDTREDHIPQGFERDPKWVIFPRLANAAHKRIEERNDMLSTELSSSRYNSVTGIGKRGIAAGGVSVAYVREAMKMLGVDCPLLKVGIPHPFPEKLALDFLSGLDEVLVAEELDPVIEEELLKICGKYKLNVKIRGKLTGDMPRAGENTVAGICAAVSGYLGTEYGEPDKLPEPPALPVRPPVLCAGCPHRASFYAVKRAMKGKKAIFTGDIGCYTLGNAAPLNMVDTCLCMGADITMAQGIKRAEPDAALFAFIGDSTFFHTGIPGMVNAVYNNADITAVILDNSTTAMTGQQPGPSTGRNAVGEIAAKIDIESVLRGIGVEDVATVNPFDLDVAIDAAESAAKHRGVSAIIFRAPCIAVTKPSTPYYVDKTKCIGCKKCIREIGCPASFKDGKFAAIDSALCYGCALCAKLCPKEAIKEVSRDD